jgi:hypothetical protein
LAAIVFSMVASCAASPRALVVTCENTVEPARPITLEIDLNTAAALGATRVWTFNNSTIEWLDELGYAYSLDRKSGLVQRVYPRTNTGYTFQCAETYRREDSRKR